MSLINDALKKAQKMRSQDPVALAPSLPNDSPGPVVRRARPMPAQRLVGIVAGGAVLVAGSVFATVFWLRKSEATSALKPAAHSTAVSESPPPPTRKVELSPASGLTAPAPTAIVAGVPSPAASVTAPIAPKLDPPPAAALPVVPASVPESAPPPPAAATGINPVSEVHATPAVRPEIRPAAPAAPAARFDARAQAFVDALHVTGIRASSSDSKVLMNDRVFRLNDIVERSLGLRLTGVAADQLIFTDGNGVVYTRNF
jgi:hypothetical protein